MSQKLFLIIFFLKVIFLNGQSLPKIPHISKDSTQVEITAVLDSLNVILRSELYKNNFINVLKYSETAVEITQKLKIKDRELKFRRYIGTAFAKMNDSIRAKKVFLSVLEEAKKLKDSNALANSMLDLGNLYNQQEKKEVALSFYNLALPLVKKQKDLHSLFVLHFNLSELYLDRKEVKKSKIHVDQMTSLVDTVSVRVPFLKSAQSLGVGRFLLLTEQPIEAIDYLKKTVAIAEAENFMDGILNGYKYYIEALAAQKQYEELYTIQKKFDKYRDEKIEIEKEAAIKALTAKMNLDQYKQELKAKELENKLNEQKVYRSRIFSYIFIAASIVLSAFVVFLLVSFKKRKKLLYDLKKKNKQYLIAKEKSEELSEAKSKFFSTISHELRTPLYGIIGISSLLIEDVKSAEHKEDVRSLKFSADYLLSLINDLLQLNKLDATKSNELEIQLFKPTILITNIISSFEFMKTQNNNTFKIHIDDSIPKMIKGDHLKLSQILMNLLGNACKFTENGIITIEVTNKKINNSYIDLGFRISDTGIGISEEKQKTIFDEFTQDTNKTNFEGTGLGLAIVKKLIDVQKGEISLQSTLGSGTEFNFLIKYLIPEIQEQQKFPVQYQEVSLENKHILIVDDNRINQIVTRKILERSKYKCTVMDNGEKAVRIVEKEAFDLILMDINMPVMNGVEATKIIRKFNTHTPIIALTAIDAEELKEEILSAGLTDIIIKPYDVMMFLEVLRQNLIKGQKDTLESIQK